MAEYATLSTDEVPRSIETHIVKSDAVLLENHGALTVGKDVYDAYFKMETLEHFASISLYAKLLGRCFITALITERGICPATEGGIKNLFPDR